MSGIYFGSLEDQVNDIFSSATVSNSNTSNTSAGNNSAANSKPSPTNTTNTSTSPKPTRSSLRIPTLDLSVRSSLIALNQPVTLFGEGPADRRERLREMAWRALNGFREPFKLFPVLKELVGLREDENDLSDFEDEEEEFYVPGPVELVHLRRELLEASFRARNHQTVIIPSKTQEAAKRATLHASLKQSFSLRSSSIDAQPGSRPLSACRFGADGGALVGDFGGRVVLVQGEAAEEERPEIAQMDGRVSAIDAQDGCLAIGSASGRIQVHNGNGLAIGRIQLYNGNVAPSLLITGHTGRIGKLAWNPQVPGLLASTSFDSTWRLWDCRTESSAVFEAQVQEGHLQGVMAGAWHPHGALFCTGGAGDGLVRVWDCRVGRAIWTGKPLPAAKMLVDAQFSPLQSHLLAVAGDDGRLVVNDLRMLKEAVLRVPAHLQACTGLRYAAQGRVLVSAGMDGAVRVWGVGEGRMIAEGLTGGRVMAFDVNDGEDGAVEVMAVGFDRSIKVFK